MQFHMKTCPPCKVLNPHLAQVAKAQKIPVIKVDCGDKILDKAADRCKITETPTVVVLLDGKEVARGKPLTEIGLKRLIGKGKRA